jgi:hypothetical protein
MFPQRINRKQTNSTRVEQATAQPVWINELLSGSYNQNENAPSTVTLSNGTIIEKARIYGIAVATEELVVDDGTGSILVRTFDAQNKVTIGDAVLVIGRLRINNQQPYFLGEIVKKINPLWLKVRKQQIPQPGKETVINIIRMLDTGNGADYNEAITKLGSNGEELIVHLLATGELFETRPGKLKILE